VPERAEAVERRTEQVNYTVAPKTRNGDILPQRGPCARLEQGSCTGEHAGCSMCTGTEMLNYSGKSLGIIAGYEGFQGEPDFRRTARRESRKISCSNVVACVRTAEGEEIVVNQTSIGKGGVGFTTDAGISLHSQVTIATHFIKGGQNIFQKGSITAIRRSPTALLPSEYELEFE